MTSTSKLNTAWTRNLRGDALKRFEEHVFNSHSVPCLVRLKQLLSDRYNELIEKEQSPSTYESPNWANLQAHMNGQRAELKRILDLLNFVDETKSK